MKKTLLYVTTAVIILSATGCGTCRNLFGFRNECCRTPMFRRVQTCAPVCCQPVCPTPACDPCCESGSSVNYGYGGSELMMPGLEMGNVVEGSSCNCGE